MAALASKGVTVPAGATLHDIPNLIGQIIVSEPEPSNPSITFKFGNSEFDPTSEEQQSIFNDSDCWERVASDYNVWKYTSRSTSLSGAFDSRFVSESASYYAPETPSGPTEVIATSDLDRVTNLNRTFNKCDELIWTPDFDVTNVTDCQNAFAECGSVTAYQLYVKLATVPNIEYNNYVFAGVSDANLIPSSWGGTA
jgi:hypothetical protein